MKRTLDDIRANVEHVGCDNATALEMCAEIERLTELNAAYKGQVECGAQEIARLTRERDEARARKAALRAALKDVAWALFQIKRMQPEAVRQFASEAHTKACAVIDDAHEQLTAEEK